VLGEVVAGLIIGPSVLGIIVPDRTFQLLAEIGILLLLFEVGLETDIGQMVKVGRQSTLVAATGIIVPALVTFWASYYVFGLDRLLALFMGGTFVATSIGITARVLFDLKKHTTRTAQVVLGAAVLDDIAGVVILAMLYDFSVTGELSIYSSLRLLAFVSAFLVLAPVIAKLLVPVISAASMKGRTKGIVPTLITSLILLFAFLSHQVGAPEILGSFAAGVALARRFFLPMGSSIEHYSKELAGKIEEGMTPIIDLFVPVFFVIVGASINLKAIDFSSGLFWKMSAVFAVLAILSKLVSGVWVRDGLRGKLATGMAMVPRGEVGLIFAEVGRRSGILDDMNYAVVVFIVAVTTLLAPLFLRVILGEEQTASGP